MSPGRSYYLYNLYTCNKFCIFVKCGRKLLENDFILSIHIKVTLITNYFKKYLVSMLWCSDFISYFDKCNYRVHYSLYGYAKNGYMGCLIAYPISEFELVTADISVVADSKKWISPRFVASQPGLVSRLFSNYWPFRYIPSFQFIDIFKINETSMEQSKKKQNTLIFLRLKSLTAKKDFCIGTYHMPCAFAVPQVLYLLTSLNHFISLLKTSLYIYIYIYIYILHN